MKRKKKKNNDEWIAGLLALGIGFLAVALVDKLGQSSETSTAKTCMYCGYTTAKWAAMCPRCRNSMPF